MVTTAPDQVFWASALSPTCASPVARVSDTPPTTTVVVAWMVVVPAVDEVMTTVHEPVAAGGGAGARADERAVAPPELVS